MAVISDIILAAGSFGAAIYCIVLSRRLRKFTDLESDIGQAISVLSKQINDLNGSLRLAQKSGDFTVQRLQSVSERGESAAKHLELLVASLHSLPKQQPISSAGSPFLARRKLQSTP